MKVKQDVKKVRNQYSAEFKKQALDRAEKDGVAATARDLNLKKNQLYFWRQKRRLEGLTTEEEKLQQSELARLKREVARLDQENSFLKKSDGVLREATEVSCAMIQRHDGRYTVALMCRVLNVSRSGYYGRVVRRRRVRSPTSG